MKNLTWIGELCEINMRLDQLIRHPVTPTVTPPENVQVLKAVRDAICAVERTSASRDPRRRPA